MVKKALTIFLVFSGVLISAGFFYLQSLPKDSEFSLAAADQGAQSFDELSRARVTSVIEEEVQRNEYFSRITQNLEATLLSGEEKNKQVAVIYDDAISDLETQTIKAGDTIVVGKLTVGEETEYVFVDRYRLPSLTVLGIIFLAVVFAVARFRGLSSLAGLVISIVILVGFIAPHILAGRDPLLVSLVGGGMIALISMFLAHGFNAKAALAVTSTLFSLLLATGLSWLFVKTTLLLGNGSEAAFYLQAGSLGSINLKGLLLAGILVGVLGALNDITISQAASVFEIFSANPSLSFRELYKKGMAVGREHIASLMNTLVLSYAGVSLPLFLLFSANAKQLWTVLNSNTVGEEIVRTLVGSLALVIAVPVCTALAAYYLRHEKLPR